MRILDACLPALLVVTTWLPFGHAFASAEDDTRRTRQAELDRACEAGREPLLAAEHARAVEHCVAHDAIKDRAACERFYADFRERGGPGFGMFYDIPACIEAFEYRRRGGRR